MRRNKTRSTKHLGGFIWYVVKIIRDHVTFKLPYDFSYHMKTPLVHLASI